MYPNQGGFPGQQYGGQAPYQPNAAPFGAGMPQPQTFGSGYPPMPPQQGGYGFGAPPQNPYGAPPMPSYPGMPQQPPTGFPPQQPQGGMYPQVQSFDAMPPQQPSYPGMAPPQPSYSGMPPAAPSYPGMPPQQSAYPTSPQHQQYGGPPPQQAPIQQAHIQQSYASPQYGQAPIQQSYASPQYGQQAVTAHTRKGRPTVYPAPNFDASNDAAALRKAMKGFGTDEDAIINILCRRPCAQRMEIVRCYKTAYGKDLISDIKSETSGNFECLLVALLTPTCELYCNELYQALGGAGTDEDAMIEVMCTMSNAEIRQIGATYYRMFGRSLEEILRDDTSGSIKRLMTSLCVGGRDESMQTSIQSAQADAQALQRAGVGRWGTDESEFNRILCLRNYEQLKLICQEYQKLTGNTLEKDIKREFSGDIEDALLAILRVANNRAEFFARRLHKSMAGLGTNDRSLIRLVVTRSEIDMEDVKEEFQRYYSKTLKSFISGDTSGHYKHALYALCGESRK